MTHHGSNFYDKNQLYMLDLITLPIGIWYSIYKALQGYS